MKLVGIIPLALTMLLILSACTTPGEKGQTAETQAWVPLFDGESLDGWIQKNGYATYRVEEGAIIGKTAKGSPNSFLCTEKAYGDFELEFEVKFVQGRFNSGVQIRSQTARPKGDAKFGRVNGPQVEIEPTWKVGAESGYIYGEALDTGWLTPKADLKPHKLFQNEAWNHFRVVAKGPRIQTWVNGQMVSDLVNEDVYQSHPEGFIGLQVHSVGDRGPFQVAWRNLRIRELSD
jgi:hypothetical protein